MRIEEIKNLCKGDVCFLVCTSKVDKKIMAVQKLDVISKGRKYITFEVDWLIYNKRGCRVKFDLTTNKLLCTSENYDYTLSTIKEICNLNVKRWILDYDTREELRNYMEQKIENNLISVLPLCKKVFGNLINFDDLKIKVKQLDNANTLGTTEFLTYHYLDGSSYMKVGGIEINIVSSNMNVTKLTEVMFHELGHVLHCQKFQLKDIFNEYLLIDDNVWSYAKTNYLENFAVAIQDAFMCNPKTKKRNEFIYNLIDNLKKAKEK